MPEPLEWDLIPSDALIDALHRMAEAGERASAALREMHEAIQRLRDEDPD
jgi:hypothetical protein